MIEKEHQKVIALVKEGKANKALVIIDKLIIKFPNNPDLHSERGVVYYHLNQPEKSIADMNLAVKLQPEKAYRYSSRAYIRDWMGDLHGAIADYEKAVELDPQDAIAHNNLGMLQEKLGYQEKANDYYKRADKLAGVERSLYDKMDELESKEKNDPKKEVQDIKKVEETPKTSKWNVLKKVFTNKAERKEFVQFIKNGFKIKQDDKKGKG